jgi:hypothetical protein
MPWIIGGGMLLGGALSAGASMSAANTQANAANNASAAQLQMFNTINQQQAPYRQIGYNALGSLGAGMGYPGSYQPSSATASPTNSHPAGGFGTPAMTSVTPVSGSGGPVGTGAPGIGEGQFTHQFNASDLNANMAPNYAWQLGQGLDAVQNLESAGGGLLSGNSLKGINDYAQNFAGNAYQQAYQNYNANQTNIFNRLADIAGLGQTANQSTANAGQNAALASSNYLTSGAASKAAGMVGSANAINGGVNNALGWNYLYNMNGAVPDPYSPRGSASVNVNGLN